MLVLPFWGLDYNFQFSPKFALGLHTDFVLESFEVEKNLDGEDETATERSHPVAPAVIGFYKPAEHGSFGLGAGGEFAKEEDYFLNRQQWNTELKYAMAGRLPAACSMISGGTHMIHGRLD